MANIGNWTAENCSTVGSGDLILAGAIPAGARFKSSVPPGKVWYSVISGIDREAGIGTFDGLNTIIRDDVLATIVGGFFNDINPTPIDLVGDAIVACTFNANAYRELLAHLSNTNDPHEVQAIQVDYDPTTDPLSDSVDVQNAMLDHAGAINERVSSMSGVITGGVLSFSSPSQISISDGDGLVFDSYSNPVETDSAFVSWAGLINITIGMPSEAGRAFIYITQASNVLQVTGQLSGVLYRENIFLGIVYYLNGVITEVVNAPSIIKQTATDLYDELIQSVNVTGAAIRPVDNVLSVWSESGGFFFPGVNWDLDRTNPNNQTIVQEGDNLTPIPFYPMTQDGNIADVPITVLPKVFNPSGAVLDPLVGIQATIHRLYSLGFGEAVGDRKFVLLYGQNEYGSAQTAKANLEVDASQTVFPPDLINLVFLSYICIEDNSTDFNDINDAWIVNEVGGGGVQSAGAIQSDHTVLVNRDAANQHPIEAIGEPLGEQLRDTLDGKINRTGDAMTGQLEGIAPVGAADLTRKDYVDGLDGQNVKLTGVQSVDGQKTFTSNPLSSNSQGTNQAALTRYDYVTNNFVRLTTNQSVAGIKTFTLSPRSSAAPSAVSDLTRKDYVDGLDGANVKLTGGQTIAGAKTFSSGVAMTAAQGSQTNHLTRKDYVDQAIADAIAAIPPSATVFPIGALLSGFNPNGVFAGTWTQWPEGTFLMNTIGGADASGGSNNAANISHTHTASQGAHNHSATQGSHGHSASGLVHSDNGNNGGRAAWTSSTSNQGMSGLSNGNSSAGSITIGNKTPAITVDSAGESANGRNRPLYKGAAIWERTS